jgi:hypothetical protein
LQTVLTLASRESLAIGAADAEASTSSSEMLLACRR